MRWKGWVGGGLVAALLLAAACGGSAADSDQSDDSGAPAAEFEAAPADSEAAVREPAAAEESAASADGSGGGADSLPAAASLDRKIVSTAFLTVETDEVSARYQDVSAIATAAGGYVSDSSFGREGDRETASVTIRVPVDSYQDVLRQLRGIGEVVDESSSANDVTEEFTDLEARLRNLRATEAQYLEFLDQAKNLEETLLLQDRINAVRLEIETVQGRLQLLEQSSSLATITVHLQPPPVAVGQGGSGGGIGQAAEDAFDASVEFLEGVARVVVSAAAFAWWLVPVAVAAVYFGRRARPKPAATGKDS
jgi:hypothetical protein